jgi:hypothetical protein
VAQYQISIAVDDVIDALKAFLTPFVTPAPIVRAQVNRVPMPLGGFVELTELLQVDLETPIVANDSANAQVSITGPKRIDVQIDFYGDSAGDQCAAVKGVYRTYFSTAAFPANIQPLYCSDGHQAPLLDAEQQYEGRWTLTASLQYNPTVSIPLQYARALKMNIVDDLL